MKKCVEKAFACALIVVSIIGSFLQTELIDSIVYVIIIPSFILSLVSFFSELSIKCHDNAKKAAELAENLSNLEQESVERDLNSYENGECGTEYFDEYIPAKIYQMQKDSVEHLKLAVIYTDMKIFFIKSKKIFDKMIFVGYTLLFVSLIFSPYIYSWISNINLNSLTLWSLTLLYITLELKSEFIARTYDFVYKICKKRQKTKTCS